MENARAVSSLARIAGRAGFAGLTLSVFSPLLAGFFLALSRIFRNLEKGFHTLFKVLLGLFSFVIFVFFWHKISPTMKAIFVIALTATLVLAPRAQTQNNPSSANNKAGHDTRNAANTLALQNALSAERGDSGTSNHQDYKATKETKILGLSPDGFAQAVAAVLLAGITGIYVVITGKMVRKVDKQARTMERQLCAMKEQLTEMRTSREQTIEQMKSASAQTDDLVRQGAAQVAALNITANIASKNADAAVKLATAVELSTQRFAQVEGAAIAVTLEWIPLLGEKTYGDISTSLHLSLKCKNEGKSAGWITKKLLGAKIFDHIPAVPDLDSIAIIFHGLERLATGDGSKVDETLIVDGHQDVGRIIVIWGAVIYSDMFSDKREMTFGYVVSLAGELIRLNLPAYNRNT